MKIPGSIRDIDDAWISQVLRQAALLADTAPASITRVEAVGAGEAWGASLYRLWLRAEDPRTPASVFVKLPAEDAMSRQVLDGFGAARREVAFYRDIVCGAEPAPVRTPRVLFAGIADDSTDYAIVLEDLAPLKSCDQLRGLSRAQIEALIDHLARFHAWGWEQPRLDGVGAVFPRLDAESNQAALALFAQVFDAAWPAVCARLGSSLPGEVQRAGERFAELLPFLVAELARPRTLIHGELRAENVFIDAAGQPLLVDFQVAGQSCGVFDVAYILSQGMRPEDRQGQDRRLVQRYCENLAAVGVRAYSFDQAWRQYRVALIYGLVYPVLASTRYDAATEHGKAVLDEMVRRAARAMVDNDALSLLPGAA